MIETMAKHVVRTLFVTAVIVAAVVWLGINQFSDNLKFEPSNSEPRLQSLRRLSPEQYRNTIRDVFGDMIVIQGRFMSTTMRSEGLLEVGASQLSLSPVGFEMAEKIAREVAAQVMAERHRYELMPCQPEVISSFDHDCAGLFISSVGRLLYRRPLTGSERQQYIALVARTVEEKHDFYAGLERSLIKMLVSPNFLFRVEYALPDRDGIYQLDAYSRAARLSFLLWNSMPDNVLLLAAENGELYHREGLERQIERMLGSPKLEDGVRAFFWDMLAFDSFDTLIKDPTLFPGFTYQVARDAEEQTLRTIIDHLITRGAGYRDLFTTRRTFLTPVLVAPLAIPLYQNNPNAMPGHWQAYEFAEGDPRAGLLAQPSFAALHAHPGRTSPTLRGKALRENLLCQEVPKPPPNVDFSIVEISDNSEYPTMRERLLAHSTNPTCAGCHKITDPIGLGLEHIDAGGRFRPSENGQAIDASGVLDGVAFTDGQDLARVVRDNPAVVSCLVNRVYTYGVGRGVSPAELKWLKSIRGEFARGGHTFRVLLRLIGGSAEFYRALDAERTASTEVVSEAEYKTTPPTGSLTALAKAPF